MRDQNCELHRESRMELASTPKGPHHLLEGLQMLPVSSDKETISSLYCYYLHRIMPLRTDKICDFLFAYAAEDRK